MNAPLMQLENLPDAELAPAVRDEVLAFIGESPKPCLAAGEWRHTDETFETLDPGSGEVLTTVCEADREAIDAAVRGARQALGEWSQVTPRDRARLLWEFSDAIEEKSEVLTYLEALDTGKRLGDVRMVDLPETVEHYRYFSGWATKAGGSTIPVSTPGILNYTVRQPVGVVAGIIPWNYPLLFASYKIAAPLALGNAVVLKPAEQTPLTALYLGKLALEVGFPAGLLSVLPGRGETVGAALVEHPDIDKVAFTGSVETGKRVAAGAAQTLKAVSLELGGKSPNIVFPDAPIEEAVMGAFFGIFFNHGQVCTAGSRLLVADEIYDEFVPQLVERAAGIRLGHGLGGETDMGPLVSDEQRERFDSYVRIGHEENAELLTGGGHGDAALGGGYFVEPTIFAGGKIGGRLMQEEVFGPLLAVSRFSSTAEAAQLANATKFGLAAGVWTRDLGTAHRMAAQLEAGTVWVNTYNRFDAASPIGGFKESGVGRELGEASLEIYTETKSVWVNTAV